jgi:fructokinase
LTAPAPIFVGVETGGTKIVCRIADRGGRTLTESRFPTTTPAAALEAIVGLVEAAMPAGARVAGIGVASFGPLIVDPRAPDAGRMLATPKPGWTGSNLSRALADHFQAPMRVDTDVGAAALAEQRLGAGRGLQALAYVTVGTGIGAGLALHDGTLAGALHPEVGHIALRRAPGDVQKSRCPFHADCAEGLAAGPAVGDRLAGRALGEAPDVRALLADYLGQLCATLVLLWSPHRIVLGGGVLSTAGLISDIAGRMTAELNGYGVHDVTHSPDYLVAAGLEHAGLEGALLLARRAADAS